MTHFYERNIVEIKNEYTTFLINLIAPFIYEGIKSVYNYAIDTDNKFLEKAKMNPDVKSPGVLKIFQTCLKEIPVLNSVAIEKEINRIKENCRCSDWFDDLVKAVIKSNIVLLTFSTSKNQSGLVNQKYHETIDTKDFIHKCYIEVARSIYNSPELFWHGFPAMKIKKNQREALEVIRTSIQEAIRKMLPIKLILMEYLKNDYVPETDQNFSNNISDSQYANMKSMVDKDLYGGDSYDSKEEKNSDDKYVILEKNLLDDQDPIYSENNESDTNNFNEYTDSDGDSIQQKLLNIKDRINDVEKRSDSESIKQNIEKENVMKVNDEQKNNSHSSHGSHGSHGSDGYHGSHGSHSSYGSKKSNSSHHSIPSKGSKDSRGSYQSIGSLGSMGSFGSFNSKSNNDSVPKAVPFEKDTPSRIIPGAIPNANSDKEIQEILRKNKEQTGGNDIKRDITESDKSRFFERYMA